MLQTPQDPMDSPLAVVLTVIRCTAIYSPLRSMTLHARAEFALVQIAETWGADQIVTLDQIWRLEN